MEPLRKPFQGIRNIIRFNWHFYMFSIGLVLTVQLLNGVFNTPYILPGDIICFLVIVATVVSLFISFYVYDLSDLYKLNWIDELSIIQNGKIVNIHAGFDESSMLIHDKFPDAVLRVFDFYDPLINTEVSIKRARRAYPPFPSTQKTNISDLQLQNNYADNIFIILSAHEIRKEEDRITFFNELKRILKHTGKIVVIEHLRDMPNFLAYNVGFFHFITKSSWFRTFKNAGLSVYKELKITPFITIFIIEKNGSKP